MTEREKAAGYKVRDVGGGLEGKYFCYEMKKSIYGRQELSRGDQEATKDTGGMLAGRESGAGRKGAFTVLTPSPHFASPGLSIPSISPRGARSVRRQEPVNSPWCKKLTLGCPAKGEGLTPNGAQPTPLLLGLLLPTPAKLNRSTLLLTAHCCCHFQGNH